MSERTYQTPDDVGVVLPLKRLYADAFISKTEVANKDEPMIGQEVCKRLFGTEVQIGKDTMPRDEMPTSCFELFDNSDAVSVFDELILTNSLKSQVQYKSFSDAAMAELQ
jgi:hypothetical protein